MTTVITALPKPARSRSTIHIAARRLRRHKAAMVSLVVIVLLVIMAVFAPWIAPYDPNKQDMLGFYSPQRKAPAGPG
ncbi:hypothetical protein ACFSC4_10855 [Deinococcus malanensis]|uniref:hypothetical protein n=1 Tax=Deinococcus malanensis TaxID=1706855 RepID=UPI0036388489